jgi:hypothetical protein
MTGQSFRCQTPSSLEKACRVTQFQLLALAALLRLNEQKCHSKMPVGLDGFTISEFTQGKPRDLMNGLRRRCSRRRRGARKSEVLVSLDLTCVAGPGIELGWEAGISTNRFSSVRRRSRSCAKPFRFCEFTDRCLFIGLHPLADCCGFCRRDVTRNVTRCGRLVRSFCRSARRSPLLNPTALHATDLASWRCSARIIHSEPFWPLPEAPALARTRSSPPWGPAAWARCIERVIHG